MEHQSKYNPNIHHRRSIRLKGYDYSQEGLYFITICCQDRACLFGQIVGAKNFSPNNFSPNDNTPNNHSPIMQLNDAGKIANECWLQIPKHFPNVVLHEHIVMPNHIHGIIEISHVANIGAKNFSPLPQNDGAPIPQNVGVDNVGAKNFSPLPQNDGASIPQNDGTDNVGAKNFSPLPQNDGAPLPQNDGAPIPQNDGADNVGAKNFSPLQQNDYTPLPQNDGADNVGAKNFSHSPLPQNDGTPIPQNDGADNVGANNYSPQQIPSFKSPSKTIGSIVRGFKIGVTKWMRQNSNVYDVWQRNYYEHIIRDEQSYQTISHYIINNPAKWKEDKFYC